MQHVFASARVFFVPQHGCSSHQVTRIHIENRCTGTTREVEARTIESRLLGAHIHGCLAARAFYFVLLIQRKEALLVVGISMSFRL